MIRRFLFILIFIQVFGLWGSNKYFRKIEIDDLYNIVGRYEVSYEESREINSYEFSYNEERLVSVEFLRSGYSISDPFFGVVKINLYYSNSFVKWEFEDSKGGKISDDNSVFSYRIKYKNGKPSSIFYYDHLNQLILGRERVAVVHYRYDGDFRMEYAFNHKGEQVKFDDGIFTRKVKFNNKRPESIKFLDIEGRAVNCFNEEYAEVRYIYNEIGNPIMISYYDSRGSLTENSKGTAYTKKIWDSNGNLTRRENYNVKGELIPSGEESAVVLWDYDKKGNKIRESHFDSSMEPTLDLMNISVYEWTHYDQGNELEQRNYSINKKLTLDDDGFASYRWKYDDRGNILQVLYYDENDNIKANPWGIAKYTWEFDPIGRKTLEVNYTDYDEVISALKYSYDDKGNLSQKANLNSELKPVLDSNGISSYKYTYNNEGILTEIRQYGVHGQLKADLDFVAIYQRKYDNIGNLIEEKYLGIDEKLVENRDGTALLRKRFLRDGSQIEFKKYNRNRIIINE